MELDMDHLIPKKKLKFTENDNSFAQTISRRGFCRGIRTEPEPNNIRKVRRTIDKPILNQPIGTN